MEFNKKTQKESYSWIEQTLRKFTYVILSKKEKGLIMRYLMKKTGYSRAQLTRQIAQYHKTGEVQLKEYAKNKFKKKYAPKDISYYLRLHNYMIILRSVSFYQKTNKGKGKLSVPDVNPNHREDQAIWE